ncbi:MAG: phosphate acyltransferase, partial [Geminicoccales bacterium]
GNLVAVISNGTAVLGLGNLGALAAKPVMEGKSVLFKRFADIDAIDLEVDTEDVDAFVDCVRLLGPTFGGINLEDIRAPGCFVIEQRLRELMDIPVFHDDQHGTAIIAAAGLINALDLTGRSLADVRLVVNGAGAAGVACLELLKAMGLPHEGAILCDTKGVVYRGRTDGMNQWKSAHAIDTRARTLADALDGADAFFGLSAAGAVTPDMVGRMARQPIVFAMANPDPEITPEAAKAVRADAIIATGRSDYPNQVNNVLGFPYIFRGALDVRATTINDAMKIAATYALAALAREEVPDEVSAAYRGRRLRYGPDYLIPAPFDPRLITAVPPAVARAAMESGVALKPIVDVERYTDQLRARLDPTASRMQLIIDRVRAKPKRVVFAEGEEEKTIRAALAWRNHGLGTPILIGREDRVQETLAAMGLKLPEGIEVHNARLSDLNAAYAEYLYRRNQRSGMLFRDCQRMVNQDRNVFGAAKVALGDADAMVTGLTRNYISALRDVRRVIDPKPGQRLFGLTVMVARGRTVFIADTTVHELPDKIELADIAIQAAHAARRMGFTPRVAFLSFSS